MIIYILPLAMPGIGSIALIAGVLLLFFGGKKIPGLMKGLGGGIKAVSYTHLTLPTKA